jgi:hypothetical protein
LCCIEDVRYAAELGYDVTVVAITGTVWNGPRFFAIKPRQRSARARPAYNPSRQTSIIRPGEQNLGPVTAGS